VIGRPTLGQACPRIIKGVVRRRKPCKKRAWGGARAGAGRPRTIGERADRTIRFERSDLEALEAIATEQGVTAADLVREAVRLYVARWKRR